MKDAFGGAFMIKLFLVFIFIYICFTALALNYAKAFKVKNKIIDYLENHEIVDLDSLPAEQLNAMNDFFEEEVLGNMNYNVSEHNICAGIETTDYTGKKIAHCDDLGIVIRQTRLNGTDINTEGVYYIVSTYVGWSIPFVNTLLKLNGNNEDQDAVSGLWKISGETRVIVSK